MCLQGITKPKSGAVPDMYGAETYDHAPYRVMDLKEALSKANTQLELNKKEAAYDEAFVASCEGKTVLWSKSVDQEEWTLMDPAEDTFSYGYYYRATVFLEMPEYVKVYGDSIAVYWNNKYLEGSTYYHHAAIPDGGYADVIFSNLASEPDYYLGLMDVEEPEAGYWPNSYAYLNGPSGIYIENQGSFWNWYSDYNWNYMGNYPDRGDWYYLTYSVDWYNQIFWSESSDGEHWTPMFGKTFENGKYYRIVAILSFPKDYNWSLHPENVYAYVNSWENEATFARLTLSTGHYACRIDYTFDNLAPKAIEDVKVDSVPEIVPDEKPDFSRITLDSEQAVLDEEEGVTLYASADGKAWTQVASSLDGNAEPFRYEQYYKVEAHLNAAEGYIFPAEMKAYVNGKKADVELEDGRTSAKISYVYAPVSKPVEESREESKEESKTESAAESKAESAAESKADSAVESKVNPQAESQPEPVLKTVLPTAAIVIGIVAAGCIVGIIVALAGRGKKQK